MKVVKFGGSSVADAEQIKKVVHIIQQDKDRKFIIVSAPGKSTLYDYKITDQLIKLFQASQENKSYDSYLNSILNRFSEIIHKLEVDQSVFFSIKDSIYSVLDSPLRPEAKLDAIKAIGEDSSAKILSAYLRKCGIEATYLNPKEVGIIVSNEPGNAQVLEESYKHIHKLRKRQEIMVIPGFFGFSSTGELVTFSRGGSDITGSIIAAGVKADVYENFTDVDSVYTVNPNIVHDPKNIEILTYKEMRELSYAGFSVFHDEALIPAFKANIPVAIKNTNNPNSEGTYIVSERKQNKQCVIGIASDSGFCSLYIHKYLMNREIGFGRKIFEILEDENISFEHAPSGIDDMSVIIRENQLTPVKEKKIINKINKSLQPDTVQIEHGLGLIMIVGEGMLNTVGVTEMAASALKQADVNIRMINQGSSEVSMMFGILEKDINQAISSLYQAFFME